VCVATTIRLLMFTHHAGSRSLSWGGANLLLQRLRLATLLMGTRLCGLRQQCHDWADVHRARGREGAGATQLGQLTPTPSEQTHPQSSRFTPRCPSVVLWTPCSGVEWRVFEPTIRVWRSGTTRKQPANLRVEGAEESLTILPDYTPTVRPPPKRC
jgi:hypothetical protein